MLHRVSELTLQQAEVLTSCCRRPTASPGPAGTCCTRHSLSGPLGTPTGSPWLQILEVLDRQLAGIVSSVSTWDNVAIAYEPVWAIGTGKVRRWRAWACCAGARRRCASQPRHCSHGQVAWEATAESPTLQVASPKQVEDVHNYIRNWLADHVSQSVANAIRIIYGAAAVCQFPAILCSAVCPAASAGGGAAVGSQLVDSSEHLHHSNSLHGSRAGVRPHR